MESKFEDECKESKCDGPAVNAKKLDKLMAKRESGDVLSNLYPFYQSKISHGLEEFYQEYVSEFDPNDEENKLVYWDIFKKFEAVFEGYLREFINEQGLDKEEFHEELSRVADQARGKSKILVKLVAAQTEYEFFVTLMKDKARDQQPQNATAKHK